MRWIERLWPRTIRGAVWRGLLIALVAMGLDAFWLEPASLAVNDYTLTVAGAKAAHLDGLRIVVITDLHAGSPYIDAGKIRRVVTLANAQHPDLILLAGDYWRGTFLGADMPMPEVAALLKPLKAKLGVYAVLGNHDNWHGPVETQRALEAAGIPVLENRSVTIRRGADTIALAGIGDDFSHHSDPLSALAEVHQPALCLTHSPDIFPGLPGTCVLLIAGHTHGGQVNLPLIGRLFVPSRYGQHYASGFYNERGHALFVSTGIGTSILPIRFREPPEISVLDIREPH
jgi:uncharacterized protein